MSVPVIKRALIASACLGALSLIALPASAQDGLGTIVTPLEPKRQVGLPNQAPANVGVPILPGNAKPAKAAQPVAPEGGEKQEESVFADWKMECLPGSVAIPCQIIHRALAADQKQVVMVMSMAYAKSSKETNIQMALPLGFAVQAGVTIDLGNGYVGQVQVSRCTAQGCLVDGSAAPEMIDAMEKGKVGSVSIKTVEGTKISLPFSLAGFGEAYSAMKKRNEAAPS